MLHPDFRKYPAAYSFLPVAAGVVLGYFLDFRISTLPSNVFIAALILSAITGVIIYKRVINLFSWKSYLYMFLLLAYGFLSMQFNYYKIDEMSIERNIHKLKGGYSVVFGVVSDDPVLNDDRIRMLVDLDSVSQGMNSYKFSGSIQVSIYRNSFADDVAPNMKTGDLVKVVCRIEDLPHRRNPGEFDYGGYLKMHGISAIASAAGFDKLSNYGSSDEMFFRKSVIAPVKLFINKVIDKSSEGDSKEFLRGLLLGDKNNLSKSTKDNFVNAGVAHIIAVSGLNVAYVLLLIEAILLLLPVPRAAKNILIIVALLFYMNLTGNSPSIVRATVMAIVFLISQMVERKSNTYNIVAFAALIIVLVDPRQLFDAGFILSFGAILSLVFFTPRITALVNIIKSYRELDVDKKLNKYIKASAGLLIGTFAAQLGTLPVTAIMFGKVSVVSLIVNLFAIPISNINLALGFVTVFFSLFSGWAAGVFAAANNFLMYYLLEAIRISANFDFSYVETYRADLLLLIVFYAVLFLLFTASRTTYKARIVISVFLVLNFVVFNSLLRSDDRVKLTYLDAGNSNSTLISMPEGTNILVNSGTSSKTYSSAERSVIPYLKREGIDEIDILIITSMDANELRNLSVLAEKFKLNRIFMPAYYRPVFEKPVVADRFKAAEIRFIETSSVINQKGKFRLYLDYNKQLAGPSMLVSFVYGSKRFVFDDAEEAADIELNRFFLSFSAGITAYRAASYGSFEFTPPETIAAADPKLIILSSQINRIKEAESINFRESLKKAGFKVMSVAETGAIILETDGNRTELIDWN